MTIDIDPETERLVREEILRGHFRSVDELIVSGVYAWREKHTATIAAAPAANSSLLQFFASPRLSVSISILNGTRIRVAISSCERLSS